MWTMGWVGSGKNFRGLGAKIFGWIDFQKKRHMSDTGGYDGGTG